jgi:allantoinase
MLPIIIRSTRVLLPSGIQPAEIEIAGAHIAAVRPLPPASPAPPAHETRCHDTDHVVMPGLVDTHVHVNEPGRTEWEGFATAVAAAAAGGITVIVDMPLNSIPAVTTLAGLAEKRRAAPGDDIEVLFWGGIVPSNLGELAALAASGVRGFKCFLAPSGVDEFPAVEPSHLRQALPALVERDLPLLVHAEWPSSLRRVPGSANPRAYATWLESRPPTAEVDAIAQLVDLAREFDARIHVVHLATEQALPLLREARADGVRITAETCPHYLTFAAEDIEDGATGLKCAPPIRDRSAREALWRGLERGDIDLIATDHSPCPEAMKADGDFLRAWGGIASLELSLSAVWTGASARGLPIARLAAWMCPAPARLAGIDGRKGAIAAGMDADLVVWDPDAEFVVDEAALRQRHKHSPYAGRRLRGRVTATYARGRLVYGDTGV